MKKNRIANWTFIKRSNYAQMYCRLAGCVFVKNSLRLIFICGLLSFSFAKTSAQGLDTVSMEEYEGMTLPIDNVEFLRKAKSVIDTALVVGKFIDQVTQEDLLALPAVLMKEFNNVQYILAINYIKILKGYAMMEVYAAIIGPKDTLYFGSPNVKFTGSGGLIGDVKLGLLQDNTFAIGNNKAHVTLKQIGFNEGCFIVFDCNGFKELAVDADIAFSRDIMLPIDNTGTPLKNGSVTSSFSTRILDFNDWIVDISIPDFTLTKYPKVAFSIRHAIIDFSDSVNDPDIVFPPGYLDEINTEPPTTIDQSEGMQIFGFDSGPGGSSSGNGNNSSGGNNNSPGQNGGTSPPGNSGTDAGGSLGNLTLIEPWRGFYIKQLKVILPKEFLKRNDSSRIAFEATNMLVDRLGVSGSFSAENIIPLEEGRMNQWAYALDEFGVTVVKSNLAGLFMNGRLELPLARELQTLFYTGEYNKFKKSYSLSVGLTDSLTFPVFNVANVTFEPNSFVKINIIEEKFYPYANLTGSMRILRKNDKNEVDLEAPAVLFEELELSTVSPYINFRKVSLSSEVRFQGSPITINEIGLVKQNELIGLFMNVDCNMEEENESGIQAGMSLAIFGKLAINDDKQKFVFEKFDLEGGSLGGKFPGFEFYGSFKTFDGGEGSVYGRGFEAKLSLALNMKPGNNEGTSGESPFSFSLDAFGIFGNVNDFRYWAVDVKASFSPCITLSAISICGFSGGAYRRMAITGADKNPATLGVSTQGNQYTPKQNVGLGVRAGMQLSFSGLKSLSGEAMFQFQFSDQGSLQQVFFEGKAEIQVDVAKYAKLANVVNKIATYSDMGVDDVARELKLLNQKEINKDCENTAKAVMRTELNLEEKRFSSNMVFTINLLDGLLVGSGESELLADIKNSKFHFYLGTFYKPMFVKANLGNLTATVDAYSMLGNDIPGFPPLDPAVASFLEIDINKREIDARSYQSNIETGSGMLFGAGVTINFEDCKWFGVNIRAKADIAARYDAGFLKFGDNARCNGSQFGIDNWYNMARFYLLIDFEVGRHKRCKNEYFHWANLDIGVFLEGQFPKPLYLEGNFIFRCCGFNIKYGYKTGDRCNITGI